MSTQQRNLAFGHLDEVAEDVRHLLAEGYEANGNWNLSQVCAHLNDWMRFPMDGYPKAAAPIRFLLWLMKTTVGRRQLRGILADGFRAKTPTMPQTVHPADEQSDAAAVEQLLQTIDRFKEFGGPVIPSPVFGELDPDEALKLQLQHCAHHLSFMNPRA